MNDWTPIASFGSEIDALLAKGQLEAEGIYSKVQLNDRGGALLGGFGIQNGPMEMLVKEKDVQKAKKLLNT